MQYEVIAVAVCCALVLVVLIRISLTLNEISGSLRKLARHKTDSKKAIASTVLGESEGDGEKIADTSEAELAAAIAIAHATLDKSPASK